MEYKRYLDEVVKTLETDEEFKKKVEASDVDNIDVSNIFLTYNLVDKFLYTQKAILILLLTDVIH